MLRLDRFGHIHHHNIVGTTSNTDPSCVRRRIRSDRVTGRIDHEVYSSIDGGCNLHNDHVVLPDIPPARAIHLYPGPLPTPPHSRLARTSLVPLPLALAVPLSMLVCDLPTVDEEHPFGEPYGPVELGQPVRADIMCAGDMLDVPLSAGCR